MSKEEVFYKKLYYYLKHPVLKSWVWPPDVEPCLKKVINWKLFKDTRQLTRRDIAKRWTEVEQNEFAYALFQILFDDQAIGFASLLSIAMDNPGTVLEGFCWLYSYEETPRSLGRLQRAATQTCFAYAKVVYGKHLLEHNQLNEALELFRHAAQDLNEPSAWYELGLFYEKGLVEDVKDDTYALQCYKKSAKLDSTIGMEQVGRCYKDGVGTQKSVAKAIKWLSRVDPEKQRYQENLHALRALQELHHQYFHYGLKVMKKAGSQFQECDCFKCRTVLYLFLRESCSPKWLSRWDKSAECCLLVIACFRHRFGASGVGGMVARHIWRTRAEDCWKHRIKN